MSFVWRASAHALATQVSHTPPPPRSVPTSYYVKKCPKKEGLGVGVEGVAGSDAIVQSCSTVAQLLHAP